MNTQLQLDGMPAPVLRCEDLDQWWTPPAIAREMVRLAGVQPGDCVLEPSAGAGNIVEALTSAGADVIAHEIDPRWVEHLSTRDWSPGRIMVTHGDYLATRPTPRLYHRAVINPPYRDGLDGLFLARVLEEADVVVALIRIAALCGQERYETLWRKHAGRCVSIHPCAARPDFTGAQEGTSGAKSDFVVLVFGAEDLGDRAPLRHIAPRCCS